MNSPLKSALQSFLDRLCNDSYSGTMFEGDADTLRDAISYIDRGERMRRAAAASPLLPQQGGGTTVTEQQIVDWLRSPEGKQRIAESTARSAESIAMLNKAREISPELLIVPMSAISSMDDEMLSVVVGCDAFRIARGVEPKYFTADGVITALQSFGHAAVLPQVGEAKNWQDVERTVDRHMSAAYQAGVDGDEFDLLAAKREISALAAPATLGEAKAVAPVAISDDEILAAWKKSGELTNHAFDMEVMVLHFAKSLMQPFYAATDRAIIEHAKKYCLFDELRQDYDVLRYECREDFFNMLRNLHAAPVAQALPVAAQDVLTERERQKTIENYTPEHDDQHSGNALVAAAICYAQDSRQWFPGSWDIRWPWDVEHWKPTTKRRNLVKAGALLLAEIERIDRAAMQGEKA